MSPSPLRRLPPWLAPSLCSAVQDSLDLCWGYVLLEHEVRNVDACFKRLDSIFNNNSRVLESARVGAGYDVQLNDIMDAEIQPILQDFYQTPNYDYVYEQRLQTASDNFVAAASQLPRVSGCHPPCGFQSAGAVYNCETCKYDSCEFPLDCPVEEIKVMENSRIRMWCKVPFDLPSDFQAVWRFAEELNTQQVDEFKEVTAGVDMLFSIPSSTLQHQGTYQCEIYSSQRSIIRLYYHVSVTPQDEVSHTELQEIFDLSLLPGGSLLPTVDPSLHSRPSAALLSACVSAVLLLLLLSLGTLYWLSTSEERSDVETDAVGDL
ncbi:hypothetical protein WMY93_008602 [Mugilogobius chulae]|uniref:Ig-like domain-containing protein n=1 Tax=Mugilogobius chulae TaxID=88201 RepID=A0AAW0PL74_9GOBI